MTVSASVLRAFGFASAEPLAGGLINQTYLSRDSEGTPAVLQRLHPIFGAEVNLDIEAVTEHLARAGLETPRLIRTLAGAAWHQEGGGTWRALTFIAGDTIHKVDSPARAFAAGTLVGQFHRAVASLEHAYAFTRAGVHDTAAHLARLDAAAASGHAATALARDILDAAKALPPLPPAPQRHTHGDLKISNILFESSDPRRARCLVDLDTLGRQTIAYELGDALRSWGNPHGEDVVAPEIDLAIVHAALRGYAEGTHGLLTAAEQSSTIGGLETVCIELAARFCLDAFEDRYFGWDPQRFSSRVEHNLVRGRGQLALGRSVAAQRDELTALATAAFDSVAGSG